MVFNETGDKDRKDAEVVLVNPRIISTSKDKKYFEEGCLSFPGMYADVIVSLGTMLLVLFRVVLVAVTCILFLVRGIGTPCSSL